MYKDNAGNWRYGNKGEELGVSYSADSIPIKWLCDYAVIIAENNYEQAKFIFRLIETYKRELNGDKDKAAIDNLKRIKENWLKTINNDLLPNCVQHAMTMKKIEEQLKKEWLSREEFEELVNYTADKMKGECGSSEFVFYSKGEENE